MKLKNTLYGLCQSPHAFWKNLKKNLEKSCLKQSEFDPCLFFGEKVTCIVRVDDLILWARNEDEIHGLAMHLQELNVDLYQ